MSAIQSNHQRRHTALLIVLVVLAATVAVAQNDDGEVRSAKSPFDAKPEAAVGRRGSHPQVSNRELWDRRNAEGQQLYDAGLYAKALEAHRAALEVANVLFERTLVGESEHQIGRAYKGQGKADDALRHYLSAEAALSSGGDAAKTYLAYLYKDIAIVHRDRGDFEQGVLYLHRSLQLGETLNDVQVQGLAYLGLGILYRNKGDTAKAIPLLLKSLKFLTQSHDEKYLVDLYLNLGRAYAERSEFAEAMIQYGLAEKLATRLNNPQRLAWVYRYLGMFHGGQAEDALMRQYLSKSLRIAERIGDAQLAVDNGLNLAALSIWHGKTVEAIESLKTALRRARELNNPPSVSYALTLLGVANMSSGDFGKAQEFFDHALNSAAASGDAWSLISININIADLNLRKGDIAKALAALDAAATLAEKSDDSDLLADVMTFRGEAYLRSRQYDRARETLTHAIKLIESGRSEVVGNAAAVAGFLNERSSAYQLLIELNVIEGKTREAVLISEAAKARALLDVATEGSTDLHQAMSPAERQQENELNERMASLDLEARTVEQRRDAIVNLAALRNLIDELRLQLTSLQNSVRARLQQRQVRLSRSGAATNFDEIEDSLPAADTVTLVYFVTKEKTYLFALTRDASAEDSRVSLQNFTIPATEQEIEEGVTLLRRRFAGLDFDFKSPARKMYDLLLGQVTPLLSGKEKLRIVPDGILWEMPFQALLDGQNKYVVDKYEISFAPSLSVAREYRERAKRPRQTSGKLLAVGRPVISPELTKTSLSLPSETEKEVRAVAGLYGAAESKLLIGKDANEAAFRDAADSYRSLHLATHGVIDDERPLDSYLQLDPSQGDDGRLRAREVMNLTLNADLAVLSACESARGKISRGEGVIGMSWAFHIAGVPTTVVSQWKVDSKSTEELMVEFHRQLFGGVGKAGSLKSAILKLKQDRRYSHPFYWASFVIVGDAD